MVAPADYSLQATTKMAAVPTEPLRELVEDGSGVDGGDDCVDDWEASTGRRLRQWPSTGWEADREE
jgi:hypothetical protein